MMEQTLAAPRAEMSPYAPRIIDHQHPPRQDPRGHRAGRQDHQAASPRRPAPRSTSRTPARCGSRPINGEGGQRAEEMIRNIIEDPEVGRVYQGKVRSIVTFGAFVEIVPGRDGLLHISEIDHHRVGAHRGRPQRRRHGDGQGHRRGPRRQDQALAQGAAAGARGLRRAAAAARAATGTAAVAATATGTATGAADRVASGRQRHRLRPGGRATCHSAFRAAGAPGRDGR